MNKITPGQMIEFKKDFYAGKWPRYRFGQAFLNHFGFSCTHFDGGECLFSLYRDDQAEKIIWEIFVEEE